MNEKEKMSIKHRLFQIFQDRLESFHHNGDDDNDNDNDTILIAFVTHICKGELNLLNSFCIERNYEVVIKPDMFRLQLEFSHDIGDLK